jgi:hypothetical protein
MDDEDADVEMLDLNAQTHDTPSPAVSSNSTSTSIYADRRQVSMTPSTALETVADDSNAILDKIASLSIYAIEKSSDNQNTAQTTLPVKPCAISKCSRLCPEQYCRSRRATSRATHSVSPSVYPALLASKPRPQTNPEVRGPTNPHEFGTESSASEWRRQVQSAVAISPRGAGIEPPFPPRSMGDGTGKEIGQQYVTWHGGAT